MFYVHKYCITSLFLFAAIPKYAKSEILYVCNKNEFSKCSNRVVEQSNSFYKKLSDSTKLKAKIFKTKTGWGYDIYLNQNLYIHQPDIPALNGKQSFKTKSDAIKIANLVKLKIYKNIFPPTITINELDSLNIKRIF